jgi:hypothetical protein
LRVVQCLYLRPQVLRVMMLKRGKGIVANMTMTVIGEEIPTTAVEIGIEITVMVILTGKMITMMIGSEEKNLTSLAVGEKEWGVVLTIVRHRRRMTMRRSQVRKDHGQGRGPCPLVHITHVQGVSHTQDREAVVDHTIGTKGLLADDEVDHIQDQEVVPGLDLVKSIDLGEVIVMIQGV